MIQYQSTILSQRKRELAADEIRPSVNLEDLLTSRPDDHSKSPKLTSSNYSCEVTLFVQGHDRAK